MSSRFKKTVALLAAIIFGLSSTTFQNKTLAHNFPNESRATNTKQSTISDFDHISRTLCDSTLWDWKLILAIAHTESNFRTSVSSHAGATGLMQIMPHTAKDLGYANADLTNPEISIEIAIKLLDRINGTLRFPSNLSEKQRLSFILASYNAGLGYVIKTRKVAYEAGAAYNDWPTLRGYITRNGTHSETVEYVDKVLKRYDYYKSIS